MACGAKLRARLTDGGVPRPARYLLRVDDLCPTVSLDRWAAIAALIAEFGLRPILAVIPENRDPGLVAGEEHAGFWDGIRSLDHAGAAIGLHGYRHLCNSEDGGLLRLAEFTEFAGIDEDKQRAWIQRGLRILRDRGLHPSVWVAPRHGFDRATLRVLRGEGIGVLSDGLARRPHVRHGMTWIPQQLWGPAEKKAGLWTICVHPNTMSGGALAELRAFVRRHASQFTSVEHELAAFDGRVLSWGESIRAHLALLRIRVRRRLRGSAA